MMVGSPSFRCARNSSLTKTTVTPAGDSVLKDMTRSTPATLRANVVASSALDNRVRLHVEVPADAKVFINDRATTSTGVRRTYFTGAVTPMDGGWTAQ